MTEETAFTAADAAKDVRPRDAAASRRALLEAALELFGTLGFERTTLREISERAGVDAALIARYFGSKSELYLAAAAADWAGGGELPEYEGLAHIVDTVVRKIDQRGPGPILQALIRSDTSDEMQVAARSRLSRRLVEPLVVATGGGESERLQAEVAVSALIGVALGRSLGWFEALEAVSSDELVGLLTTTLETLTGN
jgi:AcrR family transcriptional regulator